MKNMIWAEKWRPIKIDNLILPIKIRRAFKNFIDAGQIPNVLLYGPPGSGKTTLAMILLKEVADKKLILNASSEDRGIGTVKQKIKQFARTQRQDETKLNVVLLDEFDGTTSDAQDALKNTIDTYHKNCRFILTCNQIDKVIDPIQSRCILFKFDTFPKDKLMLFLEKILKKEKIKYSTRNIEKIIEVHYPDIRTTINSLQYYSIGGELSSPDTFASGDLREVRKFIKKGQITKLRNLWKSQVDFIGIYKYFFNTLILKDIKEDARAETAIVIADYLYKDRTSIDKEINITACAIEIMNLMDIDITF